MHICNAGTIVIYFYCVVNIEINFMFLYGSVYKVKIADIERQNLFFSSIRFTIFIFGIISDQLFYFILYVFY